MVTSFPSTVYHFRAFPHTTTPMTPAAIPFTSSNVITVSTKVRHKFNKIRHTDLQTEYSVFISHLRLNNGKHMALRLCRSFTPPFAYTTRFQIRPQPPQKLIFLSSITLHITYAYQQPQLICRLAILRPSIAQILVWMMLRI